MEQLHLEFNNLLNLAIRKCCTDIHITMDSKSQKIVLRRHKLLITDFQSKDIDALFQYIKFYSKVSLTDRFRPQTVVFSYCINSFNYQFRFACIETTNIQTGVIRILNMNRIDSIQSSINNTKDRAKITKLFETNSGIILFCGSTGSGKSTTLFNVVSSLESKQIYTLENPIERINDSWVQVEVNESLTYSEGITQLLRHDPDIIVLGEIRTEEDIRQCIRCGLSGHLVVSTIHSGELDQVIRRLTELDTSIDDLEMLLQGIIFQEMKREGNDVHIKYKIKNQREIKKLLQKK